VAAGSDAFVADLHQQHGIIVGVHKAGFVLWFAAAAIHVRVYLPGLLPLLRRAR
jgi:hypothetical protein